MQHLLTTSGMRFQLDWDDSLHPKTGAEATYGYLHLAIDDTSVWCGENIDQGFYWTWIELLEFLTESWEYLWTDIVPADTITALDFELLEEHDLANAVQGALMPSFIICRLTEASGYLVTNSSVQQVEFFPLMRTLCDLADCIAARLDNMMDARSLKARTAWEQTRTTTAL